MGMHVVIRGADSIARRFANTPARIEILARAVDAHLALIWGYVIPLTPVGVTSMLRGSWLPTEPVVTSRGVEGRLGSPLIYSEVIERGRTPGARMPPPDAIALWVERKLGPGVSPFVVARSIGRKGIKGRRMLERAILMADPQARAIWAAATARLVAGS